MMNLIFEKETMNFITPKLSKSLMTALRKNDRIKHSTLLVEAGAIIQEDHDKQQVDEFSDMILCYGPDTSVGELISMATFEESEPFTMSDFLSWLKFWT